MRLAVVLGMTLLLAGCGGDFLGAGVKHWKGPQGAETYALTCSGVMISMDTCVKKAQELCPKGYVVLDGGPQAAAKADKKTWDKPETKRQMTVECK